MTSDFFVRLTLATHKVAEILPKQDALRSQLKDAANKLLADMVLLAQENPVTPEQKRAIVPRAIKNLGTLVAYLNYAKRTSEINPGNFLLLEKEYGKVGEFLRQLHQDMAGLPPKVVETSELVAPKRDLGAPKSLLGNRQDSKGNLSGRQTRILELMRNKPKVQVWELQKVLPEVTKRTLRRDLDNLLHRNFIVRKGEWNEVFYQIR